MNEIVEFKDFRRVQKAMQRLGFTIAAQDLYARWGHYTQKERDLIIARWSA